MLNSPAQLPPQVVIARLWRESTAAVLTLYLVLAAFAYALVPPDIAVQGGFGFPAALSDVVAPSHASGRVVGFAITAFLAWRVSRGGYISWAVLFVLRGVSTVVAGLFLVADGDAAHATVFALSMTGLLLLASPAARTRLRRARQG